MTVAVYDSRNCTLGEGALWHPLRQQFYWFDIIQKKLLSKIDDEIFEWCFNEHVSAAGWIDKNHLLIAGESKLFTFNLDSAVQTEICALEAGNTITRSNDGRADPWGGFWIGTMGKHAERDAGAIYRYYQGELLQLYSPLTIPNAICFSPDRRFAYFADTAEDKIWRQSLEGSNGWPDGDRELFIDCRGDAGHPDGAVVDSHGQLWNAKWGSGRVACYSSDGEFLRAIELPANHITCPAFGGENCSSLFATSATEGLSKSELDVQTSAGQTFVVDSAAEGIAEYQVLVRKG